MKKRKAKMGFIDPTQIMALVVALIVLGVGAFAVFVTIEQTQNVGPAPSGRDCWNIGTPSNPETYNGLPTNTNGITTVTEYFDDGSSNTIDAGNYTWSSANPTYIEVNVTGG